MIFWHFFLAFCVFIFSSVCLTFCAFYFQTGAHSLSTRLCGCCGFLVLLLPITNYAPSATMFDGGGTSCLHLFFPLILPSSLCVCSKPQISVQCSLFVFLHRLFFFSSPKEATNGCRKERERKKEKKSEISDNCCDEHNRDTSKAFPFFRTHFQCSVCCVPKTVTKPGNDHREGKKGTTTTNTHNAHLHKSQFAPAGSRFISSPLSRSRRKVKGLRKENERVADFFQT